MKINKIKLKLLPAFLLLIGSFIGLLLFTSTVFARQGCCSYHGGVCGCGCCDGSPLSATCAPYYPCGSGNDDNGGDYTKYCIYKGEKMTTVGTYVAVTDDLKKVLTTVYQRDLQRAITTADVTYWADKLGIDMKDCQIEQYSEQTIHDDLANGDEYKHLQWLEDHKANIKGAFVSILGRWATDEEVNDWASKESDINVIKAELKNSDEWQKKYNPFSFYANRYKWWILGVLAFLIIGGVQYYNDNHNSKKSESKK